MLTAPKFHQHCAQLVDPKITPEARKELATEVRDSIEVVHSHEYSSFLSYFLPACKTVLTRVTEPQQNDNIIHQTRAVMLEILNRLPHTEAMKEKFMDVLALAMQVLQNDNEENAVTAIHIIFDLQKNYRQHLVGQLQPFLDFVFRLYKSFPEIVKAMLLTNKSADLPVPGIARRMTKSSQSFKVMTECPLVVMCVFQIYPTFIKTNIQKLLPLMLKAIEVEVPSQTAAVCSRITFQEFIAAQVKTLSFLAYLLKQPDLMKTNEMAIPRSVVKLLQSCPGESVMIRTELLVATRRILSSPFRTGFNNQIDLLVEPHILVGTGRAAETLRPLAYSFLAELVHGVRLELSVSQLEKIITIFSTNLHDPTFTYTLQTNAVRLLLNLIEGILKIDNGDISKRAAARDLLLRILETMVDKYVNLGEQVPKLLKSVEELRARPDPLSPGARLCEAAVGDPLKEVADFKNLLKTLTLGLKTLIWSAINIRVSQIGTISNGLITSAEEKNGGSGQSNGASRAVPRAGLLEKECEIVSRLLGAGQNCFRLYRQSNQSIRSIFGISEDLEVQPENRVHDIEAAKKEQPEGTSLQPTEGSTGRYAVVSVQEEKEMFDLFAQIFTVLDIRSFQDVFGLRVRDLFDHMVENPAALMVPQHFLANSNISKYFADILLNFLVENLETLDVAIPKTARILTTEENVAQSFLKLFKILFASLSLFPTNEPVLRRHIGVIVRRCLERAGKAQDPHNYLQMLRALFKTLTNNKSEVQFDMLYRDFMPLVEPLFSGLLSLYHGPNRQSHSGLIVELCLMIPARPSTIFPYLNLQIKPIVWALEGSRENVHYGLRTLEFWVDMLQPSYLEALLVRVEPDLTRSLCHLLRPPSSVSFGATALRIMGKLGSRARNRVGLKLPVEGNVEVESVQTIPLEFSDGTEVMLETDALISLSVAALVGKEADGLTKASAEHKSNAWKFLYACVCPFLAIGEDFESSHTESRSMGTDWALEPPKSSSSEDNMNANELSRIVHSKEPTAKLVKQILVALMGASGLPEIFTFFTKDKSPSWRHGSPSKLVSDLSRYFALLAVQECERRFRFKKGSSASGQFSHRGERPLLQDTIFLDAIVDVLSMKDRKLSKGGLCSLGAYLRGLLDFCIADKNEGPSDVTIIPEKEPVKSKDTDSKIAVDLKSPSGVEKMDIDGKESQIPHDDDETNKKDVEMKDSTVTNTTSISKSSPHDELVLANIMGAIVDRLGHCCHRRTWNAKWAGTKGFELLIDQVPKDIFALPYFANIHLEMIGSLIFVIRDCSGATEQDTIERGRRVLKKLLRICFARGEGGKPVVLPLPQPFSKVLRETTICLTMDLTCESPSARETARQGLMILGEALGCPVADILTPVKEHILRQLQQRSIRQHPFPVQVGYMEATIFCLKLERAVLADELFSSPLRNILLREVITISEDPTIAKLTEAEEGIQHKLVENKLIQTVVVKHLVQLRRRAADLLCNVSVHCYTFLQETANDDLFRRMISSFFKFLQSKDKEIVESAKRGLKVAIAKHHKPKELLQNNLRPVLANLADYKKLSIPYLQGLSRVLELFSHWFNVNLGEKLLEHLQRWTEPENLVQLKRWPPGTEARVGAAILDLFHLLPPAASRFLEKIVYMVIRLESVLTVAGPGVAHLGLKSAKAASTSPYREPLLKYCNQHASAASTFFLRNLGNEMMRQLFFVMIRASESTELRMDLMNNSQRLVSQTFLSVEGMGAKTLHIISLIDLLSRHKPEWLGSDPDLIAKLLSYWKKASSFPDASQSSSSLQRRVQEVRTIATIFIRYFSHFPEEISILFDLLPVFSLRTSCDFTFVKDFLYKSVTKPELSVCRKAVLTKFLTIFQEKQLSQERKAHALQYIVTPMITHHLNERKELISGFLKEKRQPESKIVSSNIRVGPQPLKPDVSLPSNENREKSSSDSQHDSFLSTMGKDNGSGLQSGSENALASGNRGTALVEKIDSKEGSKSIPPNTVLDASMIQRIMKDLLDQPDDVLKNYNEPLSAELLRLATLLIQYMPAELGRYRKELIKFGWNHLKREDSIAKQWAFVNVSRFFEAYQAPVKIILQVYVALLRACQEDGKDLVRRALDILTPSLPKRLVHNPAEHKYPIWIRYTKKILIEEGHSVANLVHIWQLIVRHSDLFYVARAQFVPIMVNSLGRLGLNPASTRDNLRDHRRLTLDLVELICRWERCRRLKNKENVEVGEGSHSHDSSAKKRAREATERNPVLTNAVPGAGESQQDAIEPPAKTLKSNDEQAIPVPAPQNRSTTAPGREAEDFKPTTVMVDLMLSFLVQLPFRGQERREVLLVTKKTIMLLKEVFELWPDASIRMTFLEKLIIASAGDMVAVGNQPNSSSKPTTVANNPDGHAAADAKAVPKNEKSEQQGSRRRNPSNTTRPVTLITALELTSVLTKAQGRKFVDGNMYAIRALVLPSITESVVHTAKLFASLLEDVLKACSRSNEGALQPSVQDDRSSKTISRAKPEPEIPKDSVISGGNVEGNPNPNLSSRDDAIVLADLLKVVHDAIHICMNSTDAVVNQCGLVVLKSFSDCAPEEFIKYQEPIAKCLHRVTKEKLNAPPTATGVNAGGASNAGLRGGNAPDRNSSNGVAAKSRPAVGSGTEVDRSNALDTRPGKYQTPEASPKLSTETQTLILCVSLLGDNIIILESTHRKTLFHLLWALIDRCAQVDVLLEIVRVVGSWVLWKPRKGPSQVSQKEPLSSKEKVQFLVKMVVFERIEGTKRSEELVKSYLSIILKIFGGSERRQELVPRLERAFMLGMKAQDSQTRQEFFQIYEKSITPSLPMRVTYVLAKQEWEYLSDTLWMKHASEVLFAAAKRNCILRFDKNSPIFPVPSRRRPYMDIDNSQSSRSGYKLRCSDGDFVRDKTLADFYLHQKSCDVGDFITALRLLIHNDSEVAYQAWVELLPKAWAALSGVERNTLERAFSNLLTKEYHQIQSSWPRNNIQALLDAIVKCEPLPHLRAELVFHLGSRWNAWHSALRYLEKRSAILKMMQNSGMSSTEDRPTNRAKAELEDIHDAQALLYRQLNERDYLSGMWKSRSKSLTTRKALSYEQLGQYAHAQEVYSIAMNANLTSNDTGVFFSKIDRPGKAEICFWEERWIECAKKLCQWDVLTEFSRVVVNSELLHECLWRVPDWSALKELLIKNPIEDGPQLKLYQAYVQLQENKLDRADTFIIQGYQRALERYCALPESADLDASGKTLVQFQQLIELQESARILGELNALSRHGNGSINVEQKIENVRLVLNTWRERLPSQHEPLSVWNDVLTWRNHVHAVVVNVLEALKEAASAKVIASQNSSGNGTGSNRIHGSALNAPNAQVQAAAAIAQALPQQVLVMGVNETAWNVHRFAKACRKQGCPDMALYALQKLYPFGTMELSEYFIKTKETARSFMSNPKCVENGTEYGLHELNRCNMDHFNARQKAQLFTIRGKLCASLGRDDDAVEAYSIALSTSSDVGSAWLAWGLHCDKLQEKLLANGSEESTVTGTSGDKNALADTCIEAGLEWREAAVNCFLQAVRFGSRKSRAYLPRVLRLLALDVQTRLHLRKNQESNEDKSKATPESLARHSDADIPPSVASGSSEASGPKLQSTGAREKETEGAASKAIGAVASQGVPKVTSKLIPDIPVWMWLPWTNQLILMLGRTEACFIRSILVRLAQEYPQAVFFPIRAFMEERKPIDGPEKIQSLDALVLSRPNTPALLPTANSAQMNAARHTQVAKENLQRAQQRFLVVQKEAQRMDAAITASQAGTPEHAGHVSKKAQLKEELVNSHGVLERCMREYQAAQQRQRQIAESSSAHGSTPSSRKEGDHAPKGTAQAAVHSQGAASDKRRVATGSAEKHGVDTNSSQAQGSETTGRSSHGLLDTAFAHADFVMLNLVKSHQLLYLEMDRIAVELAFRFKPLPEEHLLSLMNALLHRCYQSTVKPGREVALSFRNALEEISKMCFGKESSDSRASSIADLKPIFEAELAPRSAKDFPMHLEPFIDRLRRWQRIFKRRVDSMPEFVKLETMSRAIIKANSSDVEVFGQYCDPESCEPNTDRYAKIIRFSADVRVVRRQSGSLRGVEVVGSDGKRYHFLLETRVNANAHAAENRAAQMCRLLNAFIFSKNSEAHRRLVHLNAPTFISTGNRTRLISDDPNFSSLGDSLDHFLLRRGETLDDPLVAFRTLASESYSRRRAENPEQTGRAESIAARVDAYHVICHSRVPETCLSDWVKANMRSATNNFMFRKRLAETLGPASLVSYALAIGGRRPENILFSWSSGGVYNLHMRSLVSNRGILESDEAVPFRLTRNVRRLLGPFGLDGPFYGSMASTMQALLCEEELLRLFLDVVMRDELVGFVATKIDSMQKAYAVIDQKAGTLPFESRLLEKSLASSLDAVVKRLTLDVKHPIVVDSSVRKGDGKRDKGIDVERITENVEQLIAKACLPENLAQMEAIWQAWF